MEQNMSVPDIKKKKILKALYTLKNQIVKNVLTPKKTHSPSPFKLNGWPLN